MRNPGVRVFLAEMAGFMRPDGHHENCVISRKRVDTRRRGVCRAARGWCDFNGYVATVK